MQNQAALSQASAIANAVAKTRQAADQIGLSNKMQLYGGMRGLAGLGATNASMAGAALGTGLNAAGTMSNIATGNNNANNASFNSAMGGMSAGINSLGMYGQLQNQAAQVNNENDPWASILGAGATLGAAAIIHSDRRLKTDIELVGVDAATGLNWYEFAYRGDAGQRYIGVMADEVELVYPHAVHVMDDGFKGVDYNALGLEMIPLQRSAL
jgi:hypothetical protein